MTQNRPHLAFTINYPGKVRELCTAIKIGGPSLTGPFDESKRFADFSRAIWDTGATGTVITKNVVDALGLVPTGIQKVVGVTGQGEAPTYVVDLILPNKVVVKNVNVVEGSGASFDVLIGMDIIQMGDFFISRAEGKTMFSFCIPPHAEPTCLVKKSDRVNEAIQKRMGKATRRA